MMMLVMALSLLGLPLLAVPAATSKARARNPCPKVCVCVWWCRGAVCVLCVCLLSLPDDTPEQWPLVETQGGTSAHSSFVLFFPPFFAAPLFNNVFIAQYKVSSLPTYCLLSSFCFGWLVFLTLLFTSQKSFLFSTVSHGHGYFPACAACLFGARFPSEWRIYACLLSLKISCRFSL